MPQISIIIPVYNTEQYLDRCMNSIFAQTFTDYEVILVDDGSPDNCPAMCDTYAQKDSRVRVIHQQNSGQAAARNRALDIAQGDYIAFVDSDDWVHPQFLEILWNNAQTYYAGVSVGGLLKVTEVVEYPAISDMQTACYEGQVFTSKCMLGEIENKAWLLCDKLFHRDCFAEIRLPEGRINEDNATVYKILYEADKVVSCDTPLYYYYQNESSTVNQAFKRKHLDWLLVPEEMIAYFTKKGDTPLADKANRMYLTELCQMYAKVLEHLQDHALENELKTKLIRQYKQEKTKYPITFKTYPQVMEILFPKRAWMYWTVKSVQNKLFRR